MEPIRQSTLVAIEEETQVAVARRAVHELGDRLGLGAEAIGRAEIVVVELGNNIVQHAGQEQGGGRGQMVLGSTPLGDALQIVVMDKGAGIASVARALADGYTTGATPGLGLGAAGRLTQQFDVYSELGKGVVASACIADGRASTVCFTTAVLSTPIHGETVNGDSWTMRSLPGRDVYMLVDGLGHGLQAAEAANLAIDLFHGAVERDPSIPLTELVQQMHNAMRATRGAALLLIAIDYAKMQAICCGVGNISCVLTAPDGSARSLVSHNGTLGHQMRRVQEFVYPFTQDTVMAMHSDGLATHWKLSGYGGLLESAPATIAGVLYRDTVRGRDDATILVARLGGPRA